MRFHDHTTPLPTRHLKLVSQGVSAHDTYRSTRRSLEALPLRLDGWIDATVRHEAFDVWYQPIVDLRTDEVVAYEALTRFHDGTSPANVFTGAASPARRVALELAVIERSVTQARELPSGLDLHINMSPTTALVPELPALIGQADRHIVIEITEHEPFDGAAARALRAALPSGCTFAADDVGAGYSGLARLLDVRPDIVKIDRTLIAHIDVDPARHALVTGLVQYGAVTGCGMIAEGIEWEAERDALVAMGITHGQGFHLGRPAPLADVTRRSLCGAVR